MAELEKVIVFQLRDQSHGLNIQQVLSIEKLQSVTEVPKTSSFMKGIINLRGNITPVIDLKERLQIGETTYTDDTRILIVSGKDAQVGLIVDSATDVIDLDQEIIEEAQQIVEGIDASFLRGVAKLEDDLLLLLDLEQVLELDEVGQAIQVDEDKV